MRRIANGTQVAARPSTPAAVGTPGYASNGDPAAGVQATILDADTVNRFQEELMAFLAAAGIAPDANDYAQVLAACRALFLPRNATTGNYRYDRYTPARNTSYSRTLSFTTAVPGLVHVAGAVNVGGAAQPAICSHALYVNGSIGPSDQTTSSMSHSMTVGVAAGTHVLETLYITPDTAGPYLSVGQNLSYIFIPT